MTITHLSFDLDGTLEHGQFDKIVWNVEIPKLYAKEHGMPLERAQQIVYAEYYKALYIENVTNWTDIAMWFHRLGLHGWHDLLASMREHIHLYDDTIEVLEQLSQQYTLVMISNSEEKFLELKLDATGLRKYFTHIYGTDAFKLNKKDKAAFERPLHAMHLDPSQIVHIGDEPHADVEVPTSIGIRALLIDRKGNRSGDHVIHNLREIATYLARQDS